MKKCIGILGGTFNPIHFGHLRMAQELADALGFDEVRFIPSANPPHRTTPEVSAEHRAAMVQLAIADNPLFKLDMRELARMGASYMIDTLISLREELGEYAALCLIMGSDAFVKLDTWHHWQELLDYCHIILVQRPNFAPDQTRLSAELTALLHDHYTENPDDLTEKTNGYIHMQKITPLEISATRIRERLKTGHSVRYLMPENVIAYITTHKLYG
ncbi:MAG TPA: nicotinate-nucleotide adenylyltransferase [Methylotenera sp.]|nr:nicotinate-nucleotide adenylyltransferase [Methylotenera sp.]HPV44882.1 nicotinate-nucleotide adenylyltransferase [Methylotenera sp.]